MRHANSGRGRARHADKRRRAPFKRAFAKSLRANATEAERKLWALLRGRHLGGYRFRRQQPIGPYIVDFFCPSARLVVELDGSQHSKDEVLAYDAARGGFLAARGYRLLRFINADVLHDPQGVIENILHAVSVAGPLPDPAPLRSAGSTLPQGEG